MKFIDSDEVRLNMFLRFKGFFFGKIFFSIQSQETLVFWKKSHFDAFFEKSIFGPFS